MSFRPVVALLCAAVGTATVLSAPSVVAATSAGSTTPTPYRLTTPLDVTHQARMVFANGKLFVSAGHSGSDVKVYTTGGKLVHDITGEPGAMGMVLSADGNTLYVAQSGANKISAIDTTTFAHTEFTAGPCPTYLALAAGRLFYSFGCNAGQWSSMVSSIDPSSGGAPVAALTGQYSPPLLAGGGSTLAVGSPDLSPASLATYTADGSGTLTELNHINDTDEIRDMVTTADGATLYTAAPAGAQFKAYDSATLEQSGEFTAMAYPQAVAVSPNDQQLAGGLSSYDGLVSLYDTGTLAPIWERYGESAASITGPGQEDDQVLPGSLTFSADSGHVYGLVVPENSDSVDLFSSTVAPTAAHLRLDVAHASKHRITATAHAPAGGKVVFTGTANGTPKTFGRATANSKGIAKLTFRSPYSSSVQAQFVGSDSKLPATAKKSFTMPSSSSVKLAGFSGVKHGVKEFRNTKSVSLIGAVTPAVSGRAVSAKLEVQVNGKWNVTSRLKATLDSTGAVNLILHHATRHVLFRSKLVFHGDSLNRASSAMSKRFEIA